MKSLSSPFPLGALALLLVASAGASACAEDESGDACPEHTLSAPDSVVVTAAGTACLIPGSDSAWAFTWRFSTWPGTGYAIRAVRVDPGDSTPWLGELELMRRPPGGGDLTTAVTTWMYWSPIDVTPELLFRTDSAEEFVVRAVAPRTETGGRIAIVVARCVTVPITVPDTLPVIELAAGCLSHSFVPGRVTRVTFVPVDAKPAIQELIHVTTSRTLGGYLHPAVAGPGLDLGCRTGACLYRYYPSFEGTLGHYIDAPVAGRYTYLLGVDADTTGLAKVIMVPELPPTP
jgi:hypothetical protein